MTHNYYCTGQQIMDWHYRTVCRYQLADSPATAIRLANILKNTSYKINFNKFPKPQNNKKLFSTITGVKNKGGLQSKKQRFHDEKVTKAYVNHVKFWRNINKITLHITSGELLSNIELYPSFYMAFCCFGNQSPQIVKSKQPIAEFNVIKGAIIGARSNLQNLNKFYFLYKWAFIVAGLPLAGNSGSYRQLQSLGINNVFIFPELDKYNYYLFEPIRGLDLAFDIQKSVSV